VERLIDTAGSATTTMLIDSHERGYVAKLLVAEGSAKFLKKNTNFSTSR
jgi:hypothetical protein